jgi:hypothetical protein
MKKLVPFLLLLAGIWGIPAFAQGTAKAGETRIALVIGNGDYANVPLKNPTNDAKDMAAALQNLGFAVTLLVDADYAAMNRAVRDFGNSIKRQDAVALFFFAGHGVQYQGANYLIPAHADVESADELPYSAVNAEQVYAKMESSGARTNLIILDACRNNPFPGAARALERGLAVVGNVQPPRSLIVYSTAPGKTAQDGEGRNGVFTSALLKHLGDPGLDAELMVRRVREDVIATTNGAQVPWHNSSITGQGFFFAGRGEINVTTDPVGAEISVNGQSRGLSPIVLSDIPRFGEVEVTARVGNRTASRKVTLRDVPSMDLDLKLESEKGGLAVKANEANCKMLLDGSPVTVTASGALEGLDAGTHLLELKGDSSAYRGEVSVVGGKITPVEVVLVPFGSLVLNLPAGTSCKIDGMGISDTSFRKDYGQLPAGDYKLAVTGGDYEPYTESISVKRAQAYQFVPRLRFTAAYLSGKYLAELDSLALAEKRSFVDKVDIDQVAVFKRRVQDEGRTELQPLIQKADELQARLASIMERQAAAGVTPAPAGGQMPAQGPKQLYAAYSSEYETLAAKLQSTSLKQEDVDKAADLSLKALAQQYQDFQALATKAGDLQEKLKSKLVHQIYAAYSSEYDSLAALQQSKSLKQEDIDKVADFRSRATAQPYPDFKDLATKAGELQESLKFKLVYDAAAAKRDDANKKYQQVVASGKTVSWIGWSCMGMSAACGIASGVCALLAVAANNDAKGAATMKDATTKGASIYTYGIASLITGASATGALGLGGLFLALRPNPKPLKAVVDRLDQELAALGGGK